MPIYEYRCAECETHFEQLIHAGEERDAAVCPSCASAETRRLLSTFAGHNKENGGNGMARSNAHSCGSPSCCRH